VLAVSMAAVDIVYEELAHEVLVDVVAVVKMEEAYFDSTALRSRMSLQFASDQY
jgi:hypothetical protein